MKLPEIWPEPPVIGREDARRRNHLAVEHDGEGLADILGRHLAEALPTAYVEAKIDDRLLGLLVEAGLRVGQVFALAPSCAFLDRDFDARLIRSGRAFRHRPDWRRGRPPA